MKCSKCSCKYQKIFFDACPNCGHVENADNISAQNNYGSCDTQTKIFYIAICLFIIFDLFDVFAFIFHTASYLFPFPTIFGYGVNKIINVLMLCILSYVMFVQFHFVFKDRATRKRGQRVFFVYLTLFIILFVINSILLIVNTIKYGSYIASTYKNGLNLFYYFIWPRVYSILRIIIMIAYYRKIKYTAFI